MQTKSNTTEMPSEVRYLNGLGKDLDKVCSTIKDMKNLVCASP